RPAQPIGIRVAKPRSDVQIAGRRRWRTHWTRRNTAMAYLYKIIDSPVGQLKLVASETGLAAVLWENDDPRRVRLGPLVEDPTNKLLKEAEKQLDAYFKGKLKKFTVPLDFNGTDFQKSVWAALLTIPFGETRSYAEIAKQIGRPDAS